MALVQDRSFVFYLFINFKFQQLLRDNIKGSGRLHDLRQVFSLSVKLLLTQRELQDASIMEAVLNVMGFERYRDAAEWPMSTLKNDIPNFVTTVGSTANGGL